jgi:molybdate transport system substrate-binding protein
MSIEHQTLTGISSMATRSLLAQLIEQYGRDTGQRVEFEAVGGVDAAKRVLDGEPFDLVLLAADAMERLAVAGKIDRDSLVGVVNSPIAVAVQAGAPAPGIGDEGSIRDAVRGARAIGYSTGPSGKYVLRLLEKWGIPAENGVPRLVQARPGIPVGSLIASGEVDIGFQQMSELLHVEGITLLGPLPDSIQSTTTFSAATSLAARNPRAAQAFLSFLTSAAANPAKVANGMTAA